ncbi:MAG TPA: MraY family glycosyltransferase [Candidatus Nitrosocosmicus sp.]|nr:MraY family glycosyltransferase [Candidatus Nitrosocosmicus sp.]
MMPYYYIAPLISFLIVILVTPLVIKLAHKYKLIDDVKLRKHPANTHKGLIPRGGGVAIFIGIFLTTLLFLPLNKILIGILIGSFLIVIVGLLDDYFDLSPYLRLIMSVAIVLIVILFGLGIPYVSNPFGGAIRLDTVIFSIDFFGIHRFYLWANLFAVVWILAIMHFVDFSGGVDGQLPGFVAISSFILGILAFRFTGHHITAESTAIFAYIIGGSFLGFLYWNFYPQKIMPGYGGKALAGFLLGVLSILSWGKLGTMILVLSIPFVDALYVIMRRLFYKRSPFHGDDGHFHHRLLKLGWGRRRIAVFYWFVSLLFGVSSLYFYGLQKLMALILVFIVLAFFILIINRVKGLDSKI